LAKSKFFKKNTIVKKSYAQASKSSINNIVKIKDTFPKLPTKKVVKVNDIINKSDLVESKRKMTTKELLRKQVIIPMNITTTEIIVNQANGIITNINTGLKNSNSKTIANFIKLVDNRVIININQATLSYMNVIIKIIKNTTNINSKFIKNFHLPKSKLYLKIVGLSYYVKTTNTLVIPFLAKEVLKNTHIFNDIIIVSKPYIIKAASDSDSAVIWINI